MPLDRETILEALKSVYDPEIPVDVVNLGLIYEVRAEAGQVYVKITTTAPGCPVANWIAAQIKNVIRRLAEAELSRTGAPIPEIVVETVYDPPWDMSRVSEEGRRMLGWA
ncbi:MAG TPA: metal-sulfur cluster assembly factor [candidate division Zixibacteria bacterium]|nr:metal-sulfur cluster assembly factor [candidate division Zixibacteria bacterium]